MWQPGVKKSKSQITDETAGREYVNVVADYLPDGTVRPLSIKLKDDPALDIARVISMIHMSSTKQDGAETRYRVRIGDCEHYLFFEDATKRQAPRWFILDGNRF